MSIQSPYTSNVQAEVQEGVTVQELLLLEEGLKQYGGLRMLTPRQMKERFKNSFRRRNIDVEDITPEMWIELRRTQFLEFESGIPSETREKFAHIFEHVFGSEWPKFLTILAWISLGKGRAKRRKSAKDILDSDEDGSELDREHKGPSPPPPTLKNAIAHSEEVIQAVNEIHEYKIRLLKDHLVGAYDELFFYEKEQRGQTEPGVLFRLTEKITELKRKIADYEAELEKLQAQVLDANTKLRLQLEQEASNQNAEDKQARITFFKPDPSQFSPVIVPVLVLVLPNREFEVLQRTEEAVNLADAPSKEIAILTTGKPENQTRAAQILAEYDLSPAIEEALIEVAKKSPSPIVRAFIIDILGEKKSQKAIELLIRSLDDSDISVRNNSAIALGEILRKTYSSEAAAMLAGKLFRDDYEDSTLKLVAPVIAPILVEAIASTWHMLSKRDTIRASFALSACVKEAFPYLFQLLTGDRDTIRSNAWQLFEEIFEEAKDLGLIDTDSLLDFLEKSIEDRLWEVRYRTIHILAALKNDKALPTLFSTLHHWDVNTRPYAAYWLAETYRSRPQVIGYLVDAYLHEKDRDVKESIGHLLDNDRPRTKFEQVYTRLSTIAFWGGLVVLLVLFGTGTIWDVASSRSPWKWIIFAVYAGMMANDMFKILLWLRIRPFLSNDIRFWKVKGDKTKSGKPRTI